MAKITISEALQWKKTLQTRHAELTSLRNQNSVDEEMRYGANRDQTTFKKARYDVVALDNTITKLAREIRVLDNAMKKTNASVDVVGYEQDDAVLGELVAVAAQ